MYLKIILKHVRTTYDKHATLSDMFRYLIDFIGRKFPVHLKVFNDLFNIAALTNEAWSLLLLKMEVNTPS